MLRRRITTHGSPAFIDIVSIIPSLNDSNLSGSRIDGGRQAPLATRIQMSVGQNYSRDETAQATWCRSDYHDGDGYIAIIDGRVVHVGDNVSGFTVTAIDATGMDVELKQSR